jgi:septum formation protein
LASASPRRRELLALIFKDYRVIPSDFDERNVPGDLPPAEHVVYSASVKAREIAGKYPEALVIGADTVVVADDAILGKPADAEDAARMLQMLSGRVHQVYTGISVARDGVERSAFECTNVRFRSLSDEMISRYIATGEPMDKAGAYAIQGRGCVLIESIDGCYFNVVGLPIHRLSVVLQDFGVMPLARA